MGKLEEIIWEIQWLIKNKNDLEISNRNLGFKLRQHERDLELMKKIAYSKYTDEEKIYLIKAFFRWHTRINEIISCGYSVHYYDNIENLSDDSSF